MDSVRAPFHHRPGNSTVHRRDLPSQHDQEIPATAPIFEGHLHWQTKRKTWERRLFRFDGTSFTCLSTRKVKLPPNTIVDPTQVQPNLLHTSPSFATSLTSPLLATPKNKTLRLTSTAEGMSVEPILASYYQLPKWVVEMSNIAEVSVVKRHKGSNPLSGRNKSNRFCIRTFDGECYVMRAQKQKDLERWLFVLVKMWNFAQAISKQTLARQSLPPLPRPQQISSMSSHHQLPPPQPLYRMSANPSLSYPSALDAHDNLPLLHSVPPGQQYDSCAPPRVPIRADAHDKDYPNPALSNEKVEWIDEWRRSLAELVAQDPNIKVTPPPIEPIPEDDSLSVTSGMTSVSNRHRRSEPIAAPKLSTFQPVIRRRSSKRLTRAPSQRRHTKPGSVEPQDLDPGTMATLKKNRSSLVPHRISPHPSKDSKDDDDDDNDEEEGNVNDDDDSAVLPDGIKAAQRATSKLSRPSVSYPVVRPGSKPMIQRFSHIGSSSSPEIVHMEYFQDINNSGLSPDYGWSDSAESQSIRYHTSVRAKKVQIERGHDGSNSGGPPTMGTGVINKRVSAPLDGDRWAAMHKNQVGRLGEQQTHGMSPLQSVERLDQDDEEMSLADLQKSLQKANQNSPWIHARARSPSASSVLDNYRQPADIHNSGTPRSPHHANRPHHSLPQFPTLSPLVAPAVPPVSPSGTPMAAGFYAPQLESKKSRARDKLESWMSRPQILKSSSVDDASRQKIRPQSMVLSSHSSSSLHDKRALSGSSSRISIDRLTDSARSSFRRWI